MERKDFFNQSHQTSIFYLPRKVLLWAMPLCLHLNDLFLDYIYCSIPSISPAVFWLSNDFYCIDMISYL